jgi:hypothetical protein
MSHLLKPPHAFLQATVVALSPSHVSLLLPFSSTPFDLPFKYCVYALGGSLPPPIDLSQGAEGSKREGVVRLQRVRERLETIGSRGRVCIIGGGAVRLDLIGVSAFSHRHRTCR